MLLFRLIAVFLALNVAVTLPLWLGDRSFPATPLVPWSEGIEIEAIIIGASFLLLGCLAPRRNALRWIFLAAALILVSADQNRLQPWFYQYVVMLFLLWELRSAEVKNTTRDSLLAVVLGTIYFWSGVQKWNFTFLTEGVTWFSDPLAEQLPFLSGILALGMMLAPPLETVIGLGFFTRHFRKAALAAICMHLFILLLIGPAGRGWNFAVWPWNVAMIGLNIFLWRSTGIESAQKLLATLSKFSRGVVFCFVLFPALSFIGLWDMYLSFALYSWNTPSARFVLAKSETSECLPEGVRPHVKGTPAAIELVEWSFAELNVPPIPEPRLFQQVARDLCRHCPQGQLSVMGKPEILSGHREHMTLSCSELVREP